MTKSTKTTEGLQLLLTALDQAEKIVDRHGLHEYVGDALGELWALVEQEINNPCYDEDGMRVPLCTLD